MQTLEQRLESWTNLNFVEISFGKSKLRQSINACSDLLYFLKFFIP